MASMHRQSTSGRLACCPDWCRTYTMDLSGAGALSTPCMLTAYNTAVALGLLVLVCLARPRGVFGGGKLA